MLSYYDHVFLRARAIYALLRFYVGQCTRFYAEADTILYGTTR